VIEAYVYTSCTSCRKTDAVLRESGVAFTSRDYFRDRFSKEELVDILKRAGLGPKGVLSKRSKVYKERGEEIDALDDEELLDLMLEEPTLLRRPLVLGSQGVVLGHNPAKLNELIEANRQG
jgi:Spx/MgsR family transcriptional regulator